jgi:hypothetical protein
MDTQTLRIGIGQRLVDGRLPLRAAGLTGSPGRGESCDACDLSIVRGQLVLTGVAVSGAGSRAVHFHIRCCEIWSQERTALLKARSDEIRNRASVEPAVPLNARG